jgi:nucleotide-binding universal stress UspA family protein
MNLVQTMLHPTDFSERSRYAFQYACLLARELGARLIVLHVVPPPPVTIQGEMIAFVPPEERDLEGLRERLRRYQPDGAAVPVDHFLEEGDPAAVILRVAKTTPCDLIVMGTHGRPGLGRLLMGSVAEEVVRKAPCPVITVKVPTAKAPAETGPALQEAGRA